MKRTILLISALLAAAACQRPNPDSESQPTTTTSPARPAPSASPSAGTSSPGGASPMNAPASAPEQRADNTGRNERDRNSAAQTPEDQGESEADRRVTQQVRKSLMDDSSLSTNAKNVKIVTRDGVVTLRGPVESNQEKSQIAGVAQRADGVKRVDNQLEVAAK